MAAKNFIGAMKKYMLCLSTFWSPVCVAGFEFRDATAPTCLQFATPAGPENLPTQKLINDPSLLETWCYWNDKKGNTLIFNIDEKHVKPELTVLVSEADKSLTFGSRARGKLTIHRSKNFHVNPMPVPLTLEKAYRTGTSMFLAAPAYLLKDLQQIAKSFEEVRPIDIDTAKVEEGTISVYLDEELQPYRGSVLDYRYLELSSGPFSPLGKYEAAWAARHGTSPGATLWEERNHGVNVPWGGHCNGWAASSVLYPEIAQPLWDNVSKHVFTTSDIKSLLTEASFCVHWAFYGTRYYGRAGEDITDIHADLFHQTLRQYIEGQKKPVAFDRYQDVGVDNSVITGYEMTTTAVAGEVNKYQVHVDLRRHYYDEWRSDIVGKAKYDTYSYHYYLSTDDQKNIVSGEWISENPDFLWVPLAQKKCGRENPYIDHTFIEDTLMKLPPAHESSVEGFPPALTTDLEVGRSVELLSQPLNIHAEKLFVRQPPQGVDENFLLVIKGYLTYPNHDYVEYQTNYQANYTTEFDRLGYSMISSIALENRGTKPQGAGYQLLKINYLGE